MTETELEMNRSAALGGAIDESDAWEARRVPDTVHENASKLARGAKRSIDVIGALLLLTLLSPIWLLIALMIKLDSAGPVFFRQIRVGQDGELFAMRKYRTMIQDADKQKLQILHLNEAEDGLFKITGDPRVTRFGRFLRKTSLDEIPQLLHVLSGRMSLVGPRPLVPDEDARIQGAYRKRLTMRPGMTGAWQAAGASHIPVSVMIQMDVDYVRNWSVLGDVRLLVATIPHVLLRRGR